MKISTILLAALIGITLVGCKSTSTTGMVRVDKDSAEKIGIEITDFYDNPIYAHILYDYSKIENFDPANLHVTLTKDMYPDSVTINCSVPDCFETQYPCFSMDLGTCNKSERGSAEAIIVQNDPGHLKILALDDIGTYSLTYK